MKVNYLFPRKYKKIGWLILIPSIIIGLVTHILGYEPDFLDFKVPAVFFGDGLVFELFSTNILNEVFGILIIISSLLVGFSKEKLEDEYISKIRLESLVWAVYVNYGILLISFLFFFDEAFLEIMIFNMFTVLLFFIIRFHWQISKLKKSASYEE